MKQEYERIKLALRKAEPGTEEYGVLLSQLDLASYLVATESGTTEAKPINEKPKAEPIPAEPTALTAEVVRERLKTAAKNGVVIQPIVEKYVPEGKPKKFSSVPVDKYPELMEEINNA